MSDTMIRDFWVQRRRTAGLVERRTLEPICSALQTHSFKLALQLCQKSLRVKPYQPIVQTLQAIALFRLEQADEAADVAEEVAKDTKGDGKALLDTDVLWLCSWILDTCSREVAASGLWDRAVAAHPENITIAADAVFHYVQKAQYPALHKVCKQIYNVAQDDKLVGKSQQAVSNSSLRRQARWFFVLSSILRVQFAGRSSLAAAARADQTGLTHTQCSTILEEAIEAMRIDTEAADVATSNHCEGFSEIFLLVKALRLRWEKQAEDTKNTAAEDLLRTLNSPRVTSECEKSLVLELLRRDCEKTVFSIAEQWLGLWKRMTVALEGGDTNWATIKLYIEAAIRYSRTCQSGADSPSFVLEAVTWWHAASLSDGREEDTTAQSVLCRTKATLERLSGGEEETGPSSKERGFTLGLLEIADGLFSASPDSPMPDLIILYFKRFAHKPCCFADIANYVQKTLVNGNTSLTAVLDFLDNQSGRETPDVSTLDKCQKHLNAEKLRRALQCEASPFEDAIAASMRYAGAYFNALPLGKDLLKTDLQPADEWALLAGQALVEAYYVSGSISALETAAAILEYAIRRSKYRYHIRVLLIRIYRLLGAPSLVFQHHAQLDVRHIQLDSVAHFALERGSTFFSLSPDAGQNNPPFPQEPTTLAELTTHTAMWYNQIDSEISRSVSKAWQEQAFTIIEGYSDLQHRVTNSFSRLSVWQEHVKSLLAQGTLAPEQIEAIVARHELILEKGRQFCDNRDESILINLQPLRQGSADIAKQSAMGDRTDLPWLCAMVSVWTAVLGAALQTAAPQTTNGHNKSDDALRDLPDNLTGPEKLLVSWAGKMATYLSGSRSDEDVTSVLGIFKTILSELQGIKLSEPTWKIAHAAAIALEAYSLLDQAFSLQPSKGPDAKFVKQFRQLRQDAKTSMRAIATRLKAVVEELAKQGKGKLKIQSLQELKHFREMDEAYLMQYATQLLEARKSALSSLATAVTKKIAGN